MELSKRLNSGAAIRTWNFGNNEDNVMGQTVGVKNANGDYEPILHIESMKCEEGVKNRVVIKKNVLEKLDWTIVEYKGIK